MGTVLEIAMLVPGMVVSGMIVGMLSGFMGMIVMRVFGGRFRRLVGIATKT
jgi:hypothetical protein